MIPLGVGYNEYADYINDENSHVARCQLKCETFLKILVLGNIWSSPKIPFYVFNCPLILLFCRKIYH